MSFLSTNTEWHALSHGVYRGFTTSPFTTPPEPDNDDAVAEPHYYRAGYVLGSVLQVLLAALSVYLGLGYAGVPI